MWGTHGLTWFHYEAVEEELVNALRKVPTDSRPWAELSRLTQEGNPQSPFLECKYLESRYFVFSP